MFLFAVWLQRQQDRQDATGDLAREVAGDPGFGRAGRSLGEVIRYLRGRGASREVLQTAEAAWQQWQAATPTQGALPLEVGVR